MTEDLSPAIRDTQPLDQIVSPVPVAVPDPAAPMPPAGWHPHPQNAGLLRYWDGQQWTDHTAPAHQPPGAPQPQQIVIQQTNGIRVGGYGPTTNHVGHFILTFLTAGLWLPVWIIIAMSNKSKRRQLQGY